MYGVSTHSNIPTIDFILYMWNVGGFVHCMLYERLHLSLDVFTLCLDIYAPKTIIRNILTMSCYVFCQKPMNKLI